jgi:cell division inhibitor SepF
MSGGGVWRKTLVYLGLVEEPDEYDELPERARREPEQRPEPEPEPTPSRRREPEPQERAANVTTLRVPEPGAAHVRQMAHQDVLRTAVLEIEAFEDAEVIGARYRQGQPVLFDLRGLDAATARRVLDFVSGVTYALRGRLTKVGGRAFLLVPEGVELPPDERRRLDHMGYGIEA